MLSGSSTEDAGTTRVTRASTASRTRPSKANRDMPQPDPSRSRRALGHRHAGRAADERPLLPFRSSRRAGGRSVSNAVERADGLGSSASIGISLPCVVPFTPILVDRRFAVRLGQAGTYPHSSNSQQASGLQRQARHREELDATWPEAITPKTAKDR